MFCYGLIPRSQEMIAGTGKTLQHQSFKQQVNNPLHHLKPPFVFPDAGTSALTKVL
jgi:hypothetical protein